MNIPEEKFERLMRFLDGEMNLDEIVAFEKELKVDKELREQMGFQIQLQQINTKEEGKTGNENLRSLLDKAKNEFLQNKEQTTGSEKNKHTAISNKKVGYSYWLAAATVAALAFIASLFYYTGKQNNSNTASHDRKDTAIINHFPSSAVIVPDTANNKITNVDSVQIKLIASLTKMYYRREGMIDNVPEVMQQPVEAYVSGNNTPIQKFDINTIPKTRGTDDHARINEVDHYYKAVSFIETAEYDKAFFNLQWVIEKSTDESLRVKATWYKAIVYLKEGKITEAENLLKGIVDDKKENIYSKKAREIIEKLK